MEVGGDVEWKWVVVDDFAELPVYEQMEYLVPRREHLINEARMLHDRPTFCIVKLNGYTFDVEYNLVKPNISFIKENKDIFPSYLLPADDDEEDDGGTELESSDPEEEDQREYEEGVDFALHEDEGLGDAY